ncbi:alanyl-tRNA editing protein [Crassaminicella indica]|uniref:Alanyl-tRNA editing protein AlaX-L n=1 Tax=Crassaminicella indica TaxID=2855394 RepID=A0ABX8RAZ6_9CLOT|nr:DHHA1 domain-containing protein [Crassaminicella indica]QXM06223.1 alanyl-tRNA editing protein AlaX-L [Crassaminicella indica]
MTKKLFYDNIYQKEFTANIASVKEIDGKFHIELNQTAFYPEGGGQPCDKGTIEGLEVSYVYEKNNKIYHIIDREPPKLHLLKCAINWERRFDHMQQHLGQHILSACFHKLFDAKTVGFHLGNEFVTIDITLNNISPVQIEKVEYFANQVVFNNLHVKQLYPTASKLSELPLRKPPKVKENIRIIEIDQFDFSPCCGTHSSHTGEVGVIKIRKWEKIRGNIRIEFVCGNRALKDFYWKNDTINKISKLLSVKDIDALSGVERIFSQYNSQKKEIRKLKEQLLDYEASTFYQSAYIVNNIKIINNIFDNRNFEDIRNLAAKIVSKPDVIVLFGLKNEKAQMILSCSKEIDINMTKVFKEVCPIINGRGGGNAHTAQGGGDQTSKLEEALKTAQDIIIHQYLV